MNQKVNVAMFVACLLTIAPFFQNLFAQSAQQNIATLILQRDSVFWQDYNTCRTDRFGTYFAADVEFYHDKSGPMQGIESLTAAVKNNLCGPSGFRLRREAVPGTVQVFPLQKDAAVYGAIISGEHLFYIVEGKNERLDGHARFTHLWMLKDSVWQMTRILSYDHGPAKGTSNRKEMALPDATLQQFAGTYKGPQSGMVVVEKRNGGLLVKTNNRTLTLYPETQNRFFIKEHDLLFEFVQDEKGNVLKMQVREGGKLAEEAVRIK
jgi:hypothetical protein